MAGKILATATVREDIKLIYSAPVDSGISEGKLVINNYSPDKIAIFIVGAPGRQLAGDELQWITGGVPVTEDEKKQRALYRGDLKQFERFVEDGMMFGNEDQIRGEGTNGICNAVLWGDIDSGAARIEEIKLLVLAGTATPAEKEKLMLLLGGAYQVNTNTNNCGI